MAAASSSGQARAGAGRDPKGGDWRTLASVHYENFPVGSRLLGKEARRHLHRIYAFARTADDLADESPGGEEGRRAIQDLRGEFLASLQGAPAHPMLQALAETIRDKSLEPSLFLDLLSAFEQDTWKKRYETREEVLDYCRRSANPVGRLVLRVHGIRDERADGLSDQVCTGLQIANFLQDVLSDFEKRDRIYLPLSDRTGWDEEILRRREATEPFKETIRKITAWTAGMFERGWALTGLVRGRLAWEVRAILRGGIAVLERVEQRGYDVLSRPESLRLPSRARLKHLLLGALWSRPPRWLQKEARRG